MSSDEFLIGSHVAMKAPDMMLGSAEEAARDGENVFMLYTGAPQSSKRTAIDKLKIDQAHSYMEDHDLQEVVVHAPYIINLGNPKKPQSFHFAVNFLKQEIDRSEAMGADQIVLHPGSHVGSGVEAGIKQIIKGLNEVITPDQKIQVALETMAGKGTEIGSTFEQLAKIIDGVKLNDKLSITFDTCHTSDAGYDIKNDFDGVMKEFDKIIGMDRIKVIHLNDSKNPQGAHKDRHTNIGFGSLGFDALNYVARYPKFDKIPKILETPTIKINDDVKINPHQYEIKMLKEQKFNPDMIEDIKRDYKDGKISDLVH